MNNKKTNNNYNLNELKKRPLNLRLTSLSQINILKKFVEKYKKYPQSLEFGEIIDTKELSAQNAFEIIQTVNLFCKKHNIQFYYSTPKILTERDFNRFYNEAKNFCLTNNPYILIINNIKLFEEILSDKDFDNINIGIGNNLNKYINYFFQEEKYFTRIKSIDLSNYKNLNKDETKIKKINDIRYTIFGFQEKEIKEYCLLKPNNKNGLLCDAPCHDGIFVIETGTEKNYCLNDGFCRTHIFKQIKEKINSEYLSNKGITNFIADLRVSNEDFLLEFLEKVLLQN